MNKVVVFASGSGTNFQAVIDAVRKGRLDADITGLIASKNKIGAIEKAERAGIPHRVLVPSDYSGTRDFAAAILDTLESWKPDLIVLAGFMIKIPSAVIRKYQGKIINIHPSLLPKYGGHGFYGMRVHRAVIEAGEKESGCTVHMVTDSYDQGPVLAQLKVDIHPDDTPGSLGRRILKKEHELLCKVIRQLLTPKN
ncbi:MAG: phosphoribosylglycinamide formyltransferase [Balneolaceae bacterium]